MKYALSAFITATRRMGALIAALTLVVLGLSAPALAARTPSPTASAFAQGQILAEDDDGDDDGEEGEEDDEDDGDDGSKNKKRKIALFAGGGGLAATLALIIKWCRRGSKAYRVGRGVYRTGKRIRSRHGRQHPDDDSWPRR